MITICNKVYDPTTKAYKLGFCIKAKYPKDSFKIECDKCQKRTVNKHKYCPYCGEKLDNTKITNDSLVIKMYDWGVIDNQIGKESE